VGIDLSPAAIRQAGADAERLGIRNATFVEGTTAEGRYDAVIAIFFLHHLPEEELETLPARVRTWLTPRGGFYSLDPSARRLSGTVGRLLIPRVMKRYQTEDERELDPESTVDRFRRAGLDARLGIYDFGSSPMAGLFPGWRSAYLATRWIDSAILRTPLRRWGSNFEVTVRPA